MSEAELIQALKEADAAISTSRALLDDLARGRKYHKLAEAATRLAGTATTAASVAEALDRVQTEKARKS